MKNIQLIITAIFFTGSSVLILNGCTKDESKDAGVNGIFIVPTSQALTEAKTFNVSAAPSFINFAVLLSKPASENVNATLAIDTSLVAAFNTVNKTTYPALPAGSMNLVAANITIAAGSKLSLKDSIGINSTLLIKNSNYLLPLKVSTVSGAAVTLNPAMAVKYYLIKII